MKLPPTKLEVGTAYAAVTVAEAVYILNHNGGRMRRCDGNREEVVIEI